MLTVRIMCWKICIENLLITLESREVPISCNWHCRQNPYRNNTERRNESPLCKRKLARPKRCLPLEQEKQCLICLNILCGNRES